MQHPIEGDVRTLPHFGMWGSFELLPGEIVIWASDDISCAFYIFALPDAWQPYFVLGEPLSPSLWGGESSEETEYLALRVVPMGWLSAVGIVQAALRSEAEVSSAWRLRGQAQEARLALPA